MKILQPILVALMKNEVTKICNKPGIVNLQNLGQEPWPTASVAPLSYLLTLFFCEITGVTSWISRILRLRFQPIGWPKSAHGPRQRGRQTGTDQLEHLRLSAHLTKDYGRRHVSPGLQPYAGCADAPIKSSQWPSKAISP